MVYFRVKQEAQNVFQDLWRNGKGRILITVGAGWFLSIGVRYVYPSLLPFFRSEFSISLTISGFLLTVLWIAYALGQFPGGIIGDRIGEGNTLVFSTAISAFALLIVALSINVWMLFIGSIAFGIATALYGPTRFTIFTDIYPKRAGTAVGFTMGAGSFGNTILPVLATIIASYLTWRLGFGILFPTFICVMVLLWIVVPNRTSDGSDATRRLSTKKIPQILSSLLQKGILLVILIQTILSFVSQGFLGFYPIYLITVKGLQPETASVLYGLYFAIGIVIQLLAGLIRDRFGSKITLIIITFGYFCGLVSLLFAISVRKLMILTILLSCRNGAGVINNTFIAEGVPDVVKGSSLGLARTFWILIGALSPTFVGYFGDSNLLQHAFFLLTVLAGIAFLLSIFIPKNQ